MLQRSILGTLLASAQDPWLWTPLGATTSQQQEMGPQNPLQHFAIRHARSWTAQKTNHSRFVAYEAPLICFAQDVLMSQANCLSQFQLVISKYLTLLFWIEVLWAPTSYFNLTLRFHPCLVPGLSNKECWWQIWIKMKTKICRDTNKCSCSFLCDPYFKRSMQ